jgi:peptidoglycan/xylan/chitin deacetylase (PgdA/CDA1 family)
VILLYHGIVRSVAPRDRWAVGQAMPVQSFKRHLMWLRRRYRIVSLREWLAAGFLAGGERRDTIALTFDDGLDVTFRCVYPLLAESGTPATFFVSTSHLEHGPLLWFNVINALCFEGVYRELRVGDSILPLRTPGEKRSARHTLGRMAVASGDVRSFGESLALSHPLPEVVTREYEGMTHEQLAVCGRDDLIDIGAHTMSHPLLGQLDDERHADEVVACREILHGLSGKPVPYFAYPGGDYTPGTLGYIRNAGYEAAFCTIPRGLGEEEKFEIGRIGVYSPALYKLRLKALGIVPLMRRLGFSVG